MAKPKTPKKIKGRPKSTTSTKTIIISVRMTPEQNELIKNEFGSIQKYVDSYVVEKKFEINSKIIQLNHFNSGRQKALQNLSLGEMIELDGEILKRVA